MQDNQILKGQIMISENELKVLIVEENPDDLKLIVALLRTELPKVVISHAKNSAETREMLSGDNFFNLILLGMELQWFNQEKQAVEILQLAGITPVICILDHLPKDLKDKILSVGFSDYLLKPELDARQLYKSILYSIERKRIVVKLEESENKYKTLWRYSPIPMWIADNENLKFLFVNEAAIESYGYSRQEFLAMTLRDIKPEEDVPVMVGLLESSKKTSGFFETVGTHKKKSGELIKVIIRSSHTVYNGRSGRLIFALNVTAKTKAEEDLRLREQRFKALVQDGADLLGIVDKSGNYLYASPSTKTILGIDPEAFIGKNAFDFIHEEDKERVYRFFHFLGKQKIIKITPYRFKDGVGRYRWIETIATNLTEDPSINGIVVNSRDITERINHIKAIEDQNKKLREIAWMQSHLIRSPLARIMGLVGLLKDENMDGVSNKELLDYIEISANELDQVIRSIVKKSEQIEDELQNEFKDNNN